VAFSWFYFGVKISICAYFQLFRKRVNMKFKIAKNLLLYKKYFLDFDFLLLKTVREMVARSLSFCHQNHLIKSKKHQK